MDIQIEKNKIHNQPQTISVDNKILTLLGENGCGKSAILEAIFQKYSTELRNTEQVICFSSGVNESFSRLFKISIRNKRRFIIENSDDDARLENSINTFYFDPSWVRLLIFAATALKPEGKTHSLLKEDGLISVNNDGIDNSTRLRFPLRVRSSYVNKILTALEEEKLDFDAPSIRRSFFHEYLTNLVFHFNGNRKDIDAGDTLRKSTYTFNAENLARVLGTDINKLFSFFAWATQGEKFININEIRLRFGDQIELNNLSDGEYQLLTIYSLIDLFDSENTLFLLDEMDSHLYYENVRKLWDSFGRIAGKLITTTHSADSIILNEFNSLKIVENGKVIEETIANKVLDRLESLSSGHDYKLSIAGKVKYLILIDDYFDWFIFRGLAKRKVNEFDENLFNQIHYIKCKSGYNTTSQKFGSSKIEWVNSFKKQNGNPETKSIYLVCDRDELPIGDIQNTGLVNRAKALGRENRISINGNNRKAFLLSWKRREIENYLLSYTMLQNHGLLNDINNKLGVESQLTQDATADNEQVRRLDVKELVQPLYLKDNLEDLEQGSRGIDFDKLEKIIDEIPATEISEDIENLYNFIVQNR